MSRPVFTARIPPARLNPIGYFLLRPAPSIGPQEKAVWKIPILDQTVELRPIVYDALVLQFLEG